ncbi:MAG TPA: cyclase family protein [Candidatus Diapherotrites archaeon]|uniref:Cyclase family protein n=1 Tax=Candidatus Iainarchaeum sp. TaxID=3101447 RepID=A0A7J4IV06_9ARCH|nr:cyclase family protein [Candidatus Diapherotrites archaeon]
MPNAKRNKTRFIDLTMPLDENAPAYQNDLKVKIRQFSTIAKKGWNEKAITLSFHSGTHIDAPFHMIAKGKKLDQFPAEKFMGSAVVIDCRKTNSKNEIVSDLGKVRRGDIVLLCTGHSRKMHSIKYFDGNPVVGLQMAKELCKRGVKMAGIDSWTIDNSPYSAHKILMKKEILIAENLVNLEKICGKRIWCAILPLKIKDADGAPARAVCQIK